MSEIELVANSIAETGRPIVYSLSPGVQAFPDMGREVSSLVNMYRVTGDDWDLWSDLKTHFDVARCVYSMLLLGMRSIDRHLSLLELCVEYLMNFSIIWTTETLQQQD